MRTSEPMGIQLCDADRVVARTNRGAEGGRVISLSPADMAFVLQSRDALPVGERHVFRIEAPGTTPVDGISGTVTRLERHAGGAHINVAFDGVSVELGRSVLSMLRSLRTRAAIPTAAARKVERIADPSRIASILGSLVASAGGVRLRPIAPSPGGEISARAVAYIPGDPFAFRIDADPSEVRAPFDIETFGYNSGFVFRASSAEHLDGHLAVPQPDLVRRRGGQRHRRVEAEPETWVCFRHPLWPELVISRPVRDVSFEGLSFATDAVIDGLFPGLVIPEVWITWPDRARLRARAVVRHTSRVLAHDSEVCGLCIEPVDPLANVEWLTQLGRLAYPRTTTAGQRAGALWNLYEASGYFHLAGADDEQFKNLRADFAAAHDKLTRAPHIGCQVTWNHLDRIEGSVTIIKPYQRAWLGYQLARRRDGTPPQPGRQILRDVLLHGYEYPQRDPEFEWMVTWVRTDGQFSRHLMVDLTRRFLDDPTRADLVRFRAMRGSCERPGLRPPKGIETGLARGDERAAVLSAIRAQRSPAYVESHDLVPRRFDLVGVKHEWSRAGLLRDRVLLVARRQQVVTAAAVCEVVEDGLHLYGLFDVVRLFVVRPGGHAELTPC